MIIIELDVARGMSQDFRGASSGATLGAGSRRLVGDSLDQTLIKSAYKPQPEALHHHHHYYYPNQKAGAHFVYTRKAEGRG